MHIASDHRLTADRLTVDFARRLPRSARFSAHARRLAELAARGEVDRVLGYLDALHIDWQATSSKFDRARYAEFEARVAAAAYQHRYGGLTR